MDHDIGTTISELVCFPNWSSSGWKDTDHSCRIEVYIRATGATFSAYFDDHGVTHRLPSGEQEVHSAPPKGTVRIQLDVHYGRRTIRIYA